MNSVERTKRMHVLYSGHVQGVGFRYTVCRVALNFQVTGMVRNLSNGDVELIAEGAEQELLNFFNAIRQSHVGEYIHRDRLDWATARNEYERFGISY